VQNVVTYDVVVAVGNADLALKPGMTASLSVITAQREDVVKIPQAALRFHPPALKKEGESLPDGANGSRPQGQRKRERVAKETPRVWVQAAEQKLTPVTVQTGISDETFAELVEGNLKEGDVVVTGVRTAGKDTPQTTLPGFGMRWRR
jgi:HlyD family secretion protein